MASPLRQIFAFSGVLDSGDGEQDSSARRCWAAGVVLAGASAGSLCWHLGGPTDSFRDRLDPFTGGLRLLPYSNGVHDDFPAQLTGPAKEQRRMRIALATDPGTPGWPNEDFVAAAPGAAVLLDGCTTTPRGAGTGCLHGVAWYARTLGTVLLAAITADPPPPLGDALAGAIAGVRACHEETCDLADPRTPAATVTAVRAGQDGFEVLALSDSSIVADYGEGRDPVVLTDTHRAASTDPGAARQARNVVLARDGLQGIALLSDGAARITEVYGVLGWPALMTVLRDQGPAGLIRQVRAAEASDPDGSRWPRSKARDDATALYWAQAGARAGAQAGE